MRGMKWIPALLGLAAVPLAAQEPRCNDPSAQVQAACNAAVDAYATFQPLAGIAISGPGCVTRAESEDSFATTTVVPTLVTPKSNSENSFGKRTHPCESG